MSGVVLVECTCGRQVNPDMMVRMRGQWLCDGCRSREIREGRITLEEAARENGAPAHVIDKARRLDRESNRGGPNGR